MPLVVAAVIRRPDGRFLMARRPLGRSMAGLWEFPGGRVEPGELAEAALERELCEELGVEIAVGAPLTFAWHRELDREDILLLFYEASLVHGEPCGREGQEVAWVTPMEVSRLPLPPADRHLVELLIRQQAETPPASAQEG